MNKKDLIKLVNKRKREHQRVYSVDDGPDAECPVVEQRMVRVASKKTWRGTESQRKEALKDQAIMDKEIYCSFCDFCDELIKLLKEGD